MTRKRAIIFFAIGTILMIASKGFLFGLIFFATCNIVFLWKIIIPDIKINPDSEEFKKQTRKEFEIKYNDNGIFSFDEEGFTVEMKRGKEFIKWNEIKSMFGYKKDLWTIDSIYLDVFCDNGNGFSVCEETPGWFQFLIHSKKELSITDKSWEVTIASPAFATNLTLVFDRNNRSLDEATKEHYKK